MGSLSKGYRLDRHFDHDSHEDADGQDFLRRRSPGLGGAPLRHPARRSVLRRRQRLLRHAGRRSQLGFRSFTIDLYIYVCTYLCVCACCLCLRFCSMYVCLCVIMIGDTGGPSIWDFDWYGGYLRLLFRLSYMRTRLFTHRRIRVEVPYPQI